MGSAWTPVSLACLLPEQSAPPAPLLCRDEEVEADRVLLSIYRVPESALSTLHTGRISCQISQTPNTPTE